MCTLAKDKVFDVDEFRRVFGPPLHLLNLSADSTFIDSDLDSDGRLREPEVVRLRSRMAELQRQREQAQEEAKEKQPLTLDQFQVRFGRWLRKSSADPEANDRSAAATAFAALDKDGSGTLDMDEVAAVGEFLDTPTMTAAQDAMQKARQNQHGGRELLS